MKHYYIDLDIHHTPSHNHEIHTEGCRWMPSISHHEYLGCFQNGNDAICCAQNKGWLDVDGCPSCCPEAYRG